MKPFLAAAALMITCTSQVYAAERAIELKQKVLPASELASREGIRARIEQLTTHTNTAAPGRFADPELWMQRRATGTGSTGGLLERHKARATGGNSVGVGVLGPSKARAAGGINGLAGLREPPRAWLSGGWGSSGLLEKAQATGGGYPDGVRSGALTKLGDAVRSE
jgi:hypothetical protein